jgi:hypothetical protein
VEVESGDGILQFAAQDKQHKIICKYFCDVLVLYLFLNGNKQSKFQQVYCIPPLKRFLLSFWINKIFLCRCQTQLKILNFFGLFGTTRSKVKSLIIISYQRACAAFDSLAF